MKPEQGLSDDANGVSRNNEAEAKLYAASKNRKRNLAPRDDETSLPPPPPPAPPMQNYMSMEHSLNPNIPHPSFQFPVPPQTFPRNNEMFPSYQQYTGSIPRSQATPGPYRPQRLKVPTVLTNPTPQIGLLDQNIATQPSLYYPPPNMPNGPPGMPNTNFTQAAIVQQPGMRGINGMMGAPRSAQGMMMATYDNAWVVPSQIPLNCPPGLEYLVDVDQLLIHQQLEILQCALIKYIRSSIERTKKYSFLNISRNYKTLKLNSKYHDYFLVMTGFETKNKYMIRNTLGQGIYFAAEESNCCNRQCLGSSRPFDLNFYDHYGNVVMHMQRPFSCDSCCCPCWLQSIEVSAPPGNVIGTIHQNWSMCFPRFSVKDVNGCTMMKIHGPFWTMSCCCNDVDFNIKTANGKVDIGKITKQWSGCVQETFTDTDNFSITFPMDMHITAKALLLAGVFLIDFMYYDTNG